LPAASCYNPRLVIAQGSEAVEDEPGGTAPSFEDTITAGMHALADEISRSFDTALYDDLKAILRQIAAKIWRQRPAPSQP
jgi:hypothetical protein